MRKVGDYYYTPVITKKKFFRVFMIALNFR